VQTSACHRKSASSVKQWCIINKTCSVLSFIYMLELLHYNLSPPCNNVTTFIHILPPLKCNSSRGLVTSSIPHQYPIPIPQFIISLRMAATSTTHSFTIPTELSSSKITKSKFGPFHTFQISHRGLSPLSYPYKYILTSSLDSTGFMIKLATYTMLLSYPSL